MSIQEVKKAVASGEAIIGRKETIKALREGNAKTVYLTSNAPDKQELKHYCELAGAEVEQLNIANDELVEATPKYLRLRKRVLDAEERRRIRKRGEK